MSKWFYSPFFLSSFQLAVSDRLQIGTYVGMSTFVVGFAALAGTPITGALINAHEGYSQGIIFSASVIMGGAVLFAIARYAYSPTKFVV
jgi:hypothetical protein